MNQRMTLSAYTPPDGPYPAYVSINLEKDGWVSISVRSQGDSGRVGSDACIYVSQSQAAELFAEASLALARIVLNEPKTWLPDGQGEPDMPSPL